MSGARAVHLQQSDARRASRGPAIPVALACAVAFLPAGARAAGVVERAQAYLAAQRLPTGAYEGATATDTAIVVGAVDAAAANDATLFALAEARPSDTEGALARVVALAGTPLADEVAAAALREAVQASASGLVPGGGGADPLVLAWAARLAARLPADAAFASSVVSQLASIQHPDGGFGFADNDSDLAVTAEVAAAVVALRDAPGAATVQAAALAWLASRWTSIPSPSAVDLSLLLSSGLPLDAAATAAIASELASRQGPAGDLEGDLRATALAVQALRSVLPDLTVQPSMVVDRAPAVGLPYSVSLVITNVGRLPSGATDLAASVTDAATRAVLSTAMAQVPALAPGASVTVAVALGIQATEGSRILTAIVNPGLAISEARVDNNLATVPYRVAGPPDLVIEQADLTARPNPPAPRQALDVTVRVRNTGDAVARDVHAQLFSGDPAAGGAIIGEAHLNAVSPGLPRTFAVRIVPESLEAIRLVARVDPENAIAEASETNNAAELLLKPLPPAELTFDATVPSISPCTQADTAPPEVEQGRPIPLSYAVHPGATRYWVANYDTVLWPFAGIEGVVYRGAPAEGQEIGRHLFTNAQLVGGYAERLTIPTSGWSEGLVTFTVVADPANAVSERSEANNTWACTVRIVTREVAELWIDPASIAPEQVPAQPGQPLTIHATLHNSGKQAAVNVPISIAALGNPLTVTIPELLPGASVDVPVTATAPRSTGYYDLSYSVDPRNTIPESSKANNHVQAAILVGGRLEPISIVSDRDPIPVNSSGDMLVTLRNTGLPPGPWARMVISDASTSRALGQLTIDTLPAVGATATYRVPFATSGLLGDTVVRLGMTVANGPTEYGATTLHVQNPDFAVTPAAIRLSPDPALPGGEVTASVVVNNLGSLSAPTSVRLYRGYPEGGDLVSSGTLVVPAGGSATFTGAPFTAPASPPYTVTAVLDTENAYPEKDEANNRAIRNVVRASGSAVVAFDETHQQGVTSETNPAPYATGGYSDWAADLVARGYTVTTLNPDTDGLTAAKLVGVDVLVNSLPLTSYTASEKDTLRAFFRAGGGMAFIGDWGTPSSSMAWEAGEDDFASFLGVKAAHARIGAAGVECSGVWPRFERPQTYLGAILDHPVTAGLKEISGAVTGGFSEVPSTAQVFLRTAGRQTPANTVVGAAFPFEQGRVVVLGDTQFFDAAPQDANPPCGNGFGVRMYGLPDNRRLGLQVVDWLVSDAAKDYLPDLAFTPPTLALDRAVVTAGDQVGISFTLKNVGGSLQAASGAVVRLYEGEPASGTLVAQFPVDSLAVDVQQTFVATWDTTRSAGPRTLTAVVDPDDVVDEVDDSNNTLTYPVTVRAANDLRVDPSDIAAVRDESGTLAVTVHNMGYVDVARGSRLSVVGTTPTGQRTSASVSLPVVAARGSTTAILPWRELDRSQPQQITVTADADGVLLDPTREDDTAVATLRPPTLEVASPLPGTLWGGVKDVTWSGASDEKPDVTYFVAIAPEGGPFATLSTTTALAYALDTRALADGNYRLRVTASDGLLSAVREVPFVVANAGAAVRVFGSGSGAASSASVATGAASVQLAIPAGARVTSATLAATPVSSAATINRGPINVASASLWDLGDALWFLDGEYRTTSGVGVRNSFDEGATWTPWSILPIAQGSTVRGAVRNAHGLHVHYTIPAGSARYVRSVDGTTWTTPVTPPAGVLSGDEEGLLFISRSGVSTISQGTPDGNSWTPAYALHGIVNPSGLSAIIASGALHVVAWDGRSLRYHRAPQGADTSLPGVLSAPVTLDENWVNDAALFASNGRLFLAYAYSTIAAGWTVWVQSCELARDCTLADSWLPAPVFLGRGSDVEIGQLRPDLLAFVWSYGSDYWRVNGLEGGRRFSPASKLVVAKQRFGTQSFAFREDVISVAGAAQRGQVQFDRLPGLTPVEFALDVGAKGAADAARAGMPGTSAQLGDLAAPINAYLAAHQADAVNGLVLVPLSVTSRGVGQTLLRNLEVRYQPLTQVAAFAEPPLISPAASPGVLDTTALSLLSAGPVAVVTPGGSAVRTLGAEAAGGRWVATFDGRDDSGLPLPSGPYLFGAPGAPVGALELDDIPPTARLDVTADDAFGGASVIRGTATDADWAGTAKNFARYLLEVTSDGTTYTTIAASTTSVRSGVLGRWNAAGLAAGGATLRLTVFDRAGNSASTTRSVRISPNAPHAPVIGAPTTAAAPRDLVASTTTVSGTADAGTTVTVYVNGAAAGSSPCDGTWTVADVALPAGISSIDAAATRGDVTGPRSAPITVARYALEVALDAPARLPAGDSATTTVRVTRTSVQATPVTVRLSAVDGAGRPARLAFAPPEAVVDLPAVGGASFSSALSTAGVAPGGYRVVAEVLAGGLVPARAESAIVLEPSLGVEAVVGTDRAVYDALQPVAATLRLAVSGNAATRPLAATFAFTRPDGRVDAIPAAPIAPLAPGDTAAVSVLYGEPPLPAGAYRVDVLVLDDLGGIVATAGTAFEVRPASGAGALVGTLTVTPARYRLGNALAASYTVTNRGAPADATVDVLLLSRTTNAVVARVDQVVSIPVGTTTSGTVALPTRGATEDLVAVLVGNGRGLAGQLVELLPDTLPPVITFDGFVAGEHRSGPVSPIVTITDESMFTASVTLDGIPFTSGTPVTADATYTLAASATDVYGNSATPVQQTFTIDTVPPDIEVAGVSPGAVLPGPVTPVVTFRDLHLGATQLTLDGVAFVSGTPLARDGDYRLVATAEDLAHNPARTEVPFTIDGTPPTIAISGVADGGTYPGPVAPIVEFHDAHLATSELALDGAPFTSGTPVVTPGAHVLVASARDAAGNLATARATFTIEDPFRATVSLEADAAPRVLALVHCEREERRCGDEPDSGRTTARADERHHDQRSCTEERSTVLRAALAEAGIPHEVVSSRFEFLQKVRENRHNVRVLYRSPHDSDSDDGHRELRELTYEGGGLLVIAEEELDDDEPLAEALGVEAEDRIDRVGSIAMTGADLGPDRTIPFRWPARTLEVRAPSAKAVATSRRRVVASTNRYGAGRAVALGFDPERSDTPELRDLLVRAVRFAAQGAAPAAVPGAPQYVRITSTLTSPKGPTELQLDAWTGAGLDPLSDAGGPVTPPRTWTFPLVAGASEARTLGVSSQKPGTYAVLAELALASQTPRRLLASASLDVTVPGGAADLKGSAIAAVLAIPARSHARAEALEELRAVVPSPMTRRQCSASIGHALEATDELLRIPGPEAAAARLSTDRLLRALQVLHGKLP